MPKEEGIEKETAKRFQEHVAAFQETHGKRKNVMQLKTLAPNSKCQQKHIMKSYDTKI